MPTPTPTWRSHWHTLPAITPIPTSPLFARPWRPRAVLRWFASTYLTPGSPLLITAITAVTWLWLTPPLALMRDWSFGWVAQIYARNLALMLIIAGGLHWYFYIRRAQGERLQFDRRPLARNKNFRFHSQVRDNLYWSLAHGVTIWSAYEVLLLWAAANHYLPIPTATANPTWFAAWFVLWLWLIPIFHSLHFYLTHRWLHTKTMYRQIHSLHHRNVNVGPWSGMSMHPAEVIVYLSSVLIHLVVLSHPFHILYHLQYMIFNAVFSHTGFDALLLRGRRVIGLGRFHHQLHHRYFHCNYGNLYIPLDKWFGTFHDGTDQAHHKIFG